MATGNEVVVQALKKSGIIGQGRVPSATESADALLDLNDMLGQWNTKRLMTWDLVDVGFTSDGRVTFYTVGPAGNFNVTPRPDRLEAAYQRQLVQTGQPIDTPLYVIPAREQYSLISLKSLQSFGQSVFLDSAYPTGRAHFYPNPNANIYELHLLMKGVMPVITLAGIISAPPQYIAAMKFNLARRLRQAYGKGMKPDPELNNLARDSLDTIQQANIQVPELQMPRVLVSGGPGYNIYSDQFGSGGA